MEGNGGNDGNDGGGGKKELSGDKLQGSGCKLQGGGGGQQGGSNGGGGWQEDGADSQHDGGPLHQVASTQKKNQKKSYYLFNNKTCSIQYECTLGIIIIIINYYKNLTEANQAAVKAVTIISTVCMLGRYIEFNGQLNN